MPKIRLPRWARDGGQGPAPPVDVEKSGPCNNHPVDTYGIQLIQRTDLPELIQSRLIDLLLDIDDDETLRSDFPQELKEHLYLLIGLLTERIR